ncbi:MAG: dephospho-CoA kinase [Bacteroidales bacterium]|nr:dephospho-CoA kinase [Bacteroidales bacterium]
MKTLGITGGIGSGKSFDAKIFGRMGVECYNSDERTKQLYKTDSVLKNSLVLLLGNNILMPDGNLDLCLMASIVFGSPQLLAKVEELVHPAVMEDFERWKENLRKKKEREKRSYGKGAVVIENGLLSSMQPDFVLFESAIILEKPYLRNSMDKIVTCSAPIGLRVSRIMKRYGINRKRALQRISVQWNDEKRERGADFVIFADEKNAILPQIARVYGAMQHLDRH